MDLINFCVGPWMTLILANLGLVKYLQICAQAANWCKMQQTILFKLRVLLLTFFNRFQWQLALSVYSLPDDAWWLRNADAVCISLLCFVYIFSFFLFFCQYVVLICLGLFSNSCAELLHRSAECKHSFCRMKLSSLSEIWHWKMLEIFWNCKLYFCNQVWIVSSSCELPASKRSSPGPKLSQVFVHCLSLKQAGCSILLNPVQIICWTFRQLMAPDWFAYTCLATVVSRTLDDGWFTLDRPVKIVWLGKIKPTFLSDYSASFVQLQSSLAANFCGFLQVLAFFC